MKKFWDFGTKCWLLHFICLLMIKCLQKKTKEKKYTLVIILWLIFIIPFSKGIQNERMRDEILCQLSNQTWKNENTANLERGWLLMANCLSVFSPSQGLYKYLLKYVILISNIFLFFLQNINLNFLFYQIRTGLIFYF